MTDYETLPQKAQEAVDNLRQRGLQDLYRVEVNHFDTCASHTDGDCDCDPNVKLAEKIPRISSLPESQQKEVAAFRRSGATGRFQVEHGHTTDCGTKTGADCDCEQRLIFRSESETAAATISSAIEKLAHAVNQQTLAAFDTANAVRDQTQALAAAMARDEKVTFARDKAGKITSAKIKDA